MCVIIRFHLLDVSPNDVASTKMFFVGPDKIASYRNYQSHLDKLSACVAFSYIKKGHVAGCLCGEENINRRNHSQSNSCSKVLDALSFIRLVLLVSNFLLERTKNPSLSIKTSLSYNLRFYLEK